jgi:3-oxoacyl-[acyl-carrier-protein] synthase II
MSMRRRRIVITGLGVVAPNGVGKDGFGSALAAGHSGIRENLTARDPKSSCIVAARVTDFNLATYFPSLRNRQTAKSLSRVSQFALASAQMAVNDAGIDLGKLDPRRTAVCYGTTTGKPDFEYDAARFTESGVAGLDANAWSEFSPHAAVSHIATELGFSGPVATSSAGCCTGLMVMDWAAQRIAGGSLDTALVGSCDSLLSPLILAAFDAGQLLTRQSDPATASRPYDLRRDGLVPGEAAGAMVLESLDSAVDRGARIYAEYLAYGAAVDTGRPGQCGEGVARAVETALDNARLRSHQIDCINSHGLSHPLFDLLETRGFKTAFGSAAYSIPITSIKSMTGASFAADGMLQAISSCLILETGLIPPILNLETPDPACDLDYVTKPRRVRANRILTNTRAIGGTNSVVILGRLDHGPQ